MREACFFQDLGFYEIANVDGMITFLENRKNGFPNYLNSLKRESHDVESLGKQVGAVAVVQTSVMQPPDPNRSQPLS